MDKNSTRRKICTTIILKLDSSEIGTLPGVKTLDNYYCN